MGVTMHRLSEALDFIESRHGDTFKEIFDVPVASLPRVCIGLFV